MEISQVTLHTQFQIGPVDPRVFGGFLEHMGRAVYEGVYEPDSPWADKDGFRTDVLEALQRMNMTATRYPGGNFASGYHWLDGVGPREHRPTMLELAWQSIEPNHFGTDEYIKLCQRMGWTPMLTVNLGTGTPEEAGRWVEYCNRPAGTKYADMRVTNGAQAPYAVKLWCLGNEMDGPWQLGHVSADEYAVRAQQAAKIMRDVDASIELVVAGTSSIELATFIEWDRRVLEYVREADYISLHSYVGNKADDTADYLAITNVIDRQIEEMDAVCRFVQAKRRSKKRAYLCFDEWNVWYRARGPMYQNGQGRFAPPLAEEPYNLEDALVVAGFLNSFIRHADVVKIANIAQIVNVIAPIHTEGDKLLLQSTFYPFEMFSRRREGVSLQPVVVGPTYEGQKNGEVPYLDTSAILNGDTLHVFMTNRSLGEPMTVQVKVADQAIVAVDSAEILTGPEPKAMNSFEQPDLIQTQPFQDIKITAGLATVTLPALSVAAITFRLES
jgi:alpha-L-arabinofuranosidase